MILPWFKAFVLTILVEGPIVWLLLRRQEPSVPRLAALVLFANLATHPVVWFVFPELPIPPPAALAASEVWAFLMEAVFYKLVIRGASWTRAGLAALLANGGSFGLGLLLYPWLARWLVA